MRESENTPAWLVYQRCVAAFALQQFGGMEISIQPNVYLMGRISKTKRQIDVLVEARWGRDIRKRILIDAKLRKTKIDINDIESMIGMMEDCEATRAVIVTAAGYTPAAERRAHDRIGLSILSFDAALKYGWVYQPCLGDCLVKTEVSNAGMVLWGETLLHGTQQGLWLILQTGTCDVCHNFHVWCQDCGDRFAVPNGKIVTCSCSRQWGSIPESPSSGHVGEPTSIWLLMRENNNLSIPPVPFDRKPLK